VTLPLLQNHPGGGNEMIQTTAPRIRNLGLTLALAIVLLLILGFALASPGPIIDDGDVFTHATWTVAGSPY